MMEQFIEGISAEDMKLRRPIVMPTLPRTYTDHEIQTRFPYYWFLVPKTIAANARWRHTIYRIAGENPEFAELIVKIAHLDELFCINTLYWTYAPKDFDQNFTRPMVQWWQQVQFTINLIDQDSDQLWEKSRDEGVTWCVMCDYAYRLTDKKKESILMASIDADMVDMADNEDTLFAKIDFILKNLPLWYKAVRDVDYRRLKFSFGHFRTDTKLNGMATTDDLGRGGRRSRAFFDEWPTVRNAGEVRSATQQITRKRLFTGTPKDIQDNNVELSKAKSIKIGALHWSGNPKKSIGLYTVGRDGKPELLDVEYWTPERVEAYAFRKEVPLAPDYPYRSPWFDIEYDREPNKELAERELNMFRGANTSHLFYHKLVRELQAECAREPMLSGCLVDGRFEYKDGPFPVKLWVPINELTGRPECALPGVVCDPATGTGANNTVIKFGDLAKGQIWGSVVSNKLDPVLAADLAADIGFWLGGAVIKYDANGCGISFGQGLARREYPNVWRDGRKSAPGWTPSQKNKLAAMTEYRFGVEHRLVHSYDWMDFEEMLGWRTSPDGNSVDWDGKIESEPRNHGDRSMTNALFWSLAKEHVHKYVNTSPEAVELARNREREDAVRKYLASIEKNSRTRRSHGATRGRYFS